jgi:CHAT domain-containing protein
VYESLPAAAEEAAAIEDLLAPHSAEIHLKHLRGKRATFEAAYDEIRHNKFHIVHFCGHANFSVGGPQRSGLVLFDKDFTSGHVRSTFGKRPPLLFVVNACESAALAGGASRSWRDSYDMFGLARSFLETGAYLIGTRWKVSDEAAKAFAKQFYGDIIAGEAFGKALCDGREACQRGAPEDPLSWASYVLYGDPRVRLQRV